MFGFDIHLIDVELALTADGENHVLLRAVTPDGQTADADIQTVAATPPPEPPTSLTPTQYDPQTHTLTLSIS